MLKQRHWYDCIQYTKLRQDYEQVERKRLPISRLKCLYCLLRIPSAALALVLGFLARSGGFFEVDLALGGGGI